MKILFDNGTPNPIARSLVGHEVHFARRIGWHELKNGELLRRAEEAGYDVLLTTDKNIRYQQNLTGRTIAIVVLGNPQWPDVRLHLDRVASAVNCRIAWQLHRSGDPILSRLSATMERYPRRSCVVSRRRASRYGRVCCHPSR